MILASHSIGHALSHMDWGAFLAIGFLFLIFRTWMGSK